MRFVCVEAKSLCCGTTEIGRLLAFNLPINSPLSASWQAKSLIDRWTGCLRFSTQG